MGNACGCGGSTETGEIKIKRPSALDFREVTDDFKTMAGNLSTGEMKSVVKIQAHARGA